MKNDHNYAPVSVVRGRNEYSKRSVRIQRLGREFKYDALEVLMLASEFGQRANGGNFNAFIQDSAETLLAEKPADQWARGELQRAAWLLAVKRLRAKEPVPVRKYWQR